MGATPQAGYGRELIEKNLLLIMFDKRCRHGHLMKKRSFADVYVGHDYRGIGFSNENNIHVDIWPLNLVYFKLGYIEFVMAGVRHAELYC